MATVGTIFVLVGILLLGSATALLLGLMVLWWRLRQWRRGRVATTGAVSKLPRRTAWRAAVEVTYLDPSGGVHVLRQRWNAAGHRPRIGTPVTVRHRADRAEVAVVDAPWLGTPATIAVLRPLVVVAGALGLLSALVGGGLLLIVRWGHLG